MATASHRHRVTLDEQVYRGLQALAQAHERPVADALDDLVRDGLRQAQTAALAWERTDARPPDICEVCGLPGALPWKSMPGHRLCRRCREEHQEQVLARERELDYEAAIVKRPELAALQAKGGE